MEGKEDVAENNVTEHNENTEEYENSGVSSEDSDNKNSESENEI